LLVKWFLSKRFPTLRGEGGRLLDQRYFDVDIIWDLYSHDSPHCPFIGVDIN
jgi:hypothetical protein